ncbi:hypothetical protein VTO73DRAFT_10080 [Trametes versicolor]
MVNPSKHHTRQLHICRPTCVKRTYGPPKSNGNRQQDLEAQISSEPEEPHAVQPQPRASMETSEKLKESMESEGRSSSESIAVALGEEAKSNEKVDEPVVETQREV